MARTTTSNEKFAFAVRTAEGSNNTLARFETRAEASAFCAIENREEDGSPLNVAVTTVRRQASLPPFPSLS